MCHLLEEAHLLTMTTNDMDEKFTPSNNITESMQSIMKNPILCNFLGGVETVLVGDKMASQPEDASPDERNSHIRHCDRAVKRPCIVGECTAIRYHCEESVGQRAIPI